MNYQIGKVYKSKSINPARSGKEEWTVIVLLDDGGAILQLTGDIGVVNPKNPPCYRKFDNNGKCIGEGGLPSEYRTINEPGVIMYYAYMEPINYNNDPCFCEKAMFTGLYSSEKALLSAAEWAFKWKVIKVLSIRV